MRFADQWRITTFRLAVFFGIFFGAAVVSLLGFIYWKTAVYLDSQADAAISGMMRAYTSMSRAELLRQIDYSVIYDARHINMIGLFGRDGRPVAGNLRYLPALPRDGELHRFSYDSTLRHVDKHELQDIAAVLPANSAFVQKLDLEQTSGTAVARVATLPSGDKLVLGRDITQLMEIRRVIERALIGGGCGILLLGLLGGFALTLRPLRRIKAIREMTQRIRLGEMQLRIPTRGDYDELDMLGNTVNRMLDEIARLLAEVKSVTDTIAHDLRTPLTRLRALLYRTLQECEPGDRRYAMFEQAVAETDVLLRRFRALLRIAEIEGRERRAGFAPVDLARVVEQIVELFEPLAEEKGLRIDTAVEPVDNVMADPDLLFEALSNLVDNAVKFTPAGGTVQLRLTMDTSGPRLDISDSGPGVQRHEREAVLRRFYRSDRHTDEPGFGLGLSIVAAVVTLHGFKLEFQDVARGTHLTLFCWPHPLTEL